ncbi:hypothetical protein DNTS_004818 [Danionella cerebrum]|nr:hypothetical protein DNTS_004818 [Danionella translucida]
MSRYKRTGPRLHRHCESCYSHQCRAPIEISASCMFIKCRLLCGASFHLCKEEEHSLLCPNEKVPCINSHYGCPFTMCRSRLARHLEVCPASTVCCSMEWNRWPVENPDAPLYTNLLKELQKQDSLSLSMALRDQKHLCARLKMRNCFPELMEDQEEATNPVQDDDKVGATGRVAVCKSRQGASDSINEPSKNCEKTQSENVTHSGNIDKEKYNLFEKMFSMEKGGCKQAEVKVETSRTEDTKEKKTAVKVPSTKLQDACPETKKEETNEPQVDISKTGLAPWQDGVLERLGQEVKPREFNMYIVHHGRMLISFGQMDACTPREKDFVYGSLEPIPVQTLRSFKVPSSYRQRRIQLKEFNTRVMTEHKCVGTSDTLEVSAEDLMKMDEMFATLLCSAEAEIRGHKISEMVPTDGLYVDIATQTYNFATAPFKYNATLSEVTTDMAVKLHMELDTETATLRHNKFTSSFSFMCGHFFRRDEFDSHFRNVHLDIQSCLSGWFEQRCPLAYLGCTFSQRRLQPSTHRAKVYYNQDLSIFTLTPDVPSSLLKSSHKVSLKYEDSLSNLPFEVLHHIASYLDSFTLSQLALVSHLFRDICATHLQERGMVTLKWHKKSYSHGGSCWKPTIVWEFSTLFSKVDHWCIGDTPSMAEHLKSCPFYETELKTEPFALTSLFENKGQQTNNLHLMVCPASIVTCSMEWNRWPVEESETPELYDNILNENYCQEPLDLSMALRDQHYLFQSLKMKSLFPELIERVVEEPSNVVLEGAVGGDLFANEVMDESASTSVEVEEEGLTQEEREELARNPNVVNLESYNVWERMFSMELSGCKHTIKSLGQTPETKPQANTRRLCLLPEESETNGDPSDVPQYNANEMDEDKYLIASSLYACDTRPKKKFLYKRLEPMKIKTVRTFKVPTSFKARQGRIRNPSHNKRVNIGVDTSDLGVEMDDVPKWDEVQATLLCSLERELRGHLIAKSGSTDALFMDTGTQTYDFYTAPFKPESSLADITAERALKLHVHIQSESVTRRHNKSSSVFTYLCNHTFRRDEFPSHYKNAHADIQSCVSGWFEQRCPLAYLGCTFIQRRFQPSSHRATVFYDKELSTFCLRPEVSDSLFEGIKPVNVERKRARNTDALSRLPFEVLVHVAGFLDSFTLSQLALVSRLMREVCGTLLHDRGMVSLKWEKKVYSHGGWCWRAKKRVWQFSNLFSTVDSWRFDKMAPISEHLKVCPYYEMESKTEPVPLTGVYESQEKRANRNQSLVIGPVFGGDTTKYPITLWEECVINGKDGVNGNSGRDGLPGQKGEKGAPALQVAQNNITFKGDKGEQGALGDRGSKGFMGPTGPQGHLGAMGPKGPSKSIITADIPQKAAFCVLRNTNRARYANPVIFDTHFSNVQNNFDLRTGTFTCTNPGVYYFVFHASYPEGLCVRLKITSSVGASDKSFSFCDSRPLLTVVSGGAVLELSANDKVWIEPFSDKDVGMTPKNLSAVFSGFLIFE